MTPSGTPLQNASGATKKMGMISAVAMSLSGMMGSGLYSVLGYAFLTDGTYIPIAFFTAAVAVSFTVYSFCKLSATYPGRGGGPAEFMHSCYGNKFISGWIHIFMCLGFLLAAALYAASFTDFISTLTGPLLSAGQLKVVGSVVVVFFALLNLLGANIVGRVAAGSIGLVFIALIIFSVAGMAHMDYGSLRWKGGSLQGIAVATGMLYINFQGFAVVTSAAQSMADPSKMVPRSMTIAVTLITLLYLVVSWVAIQVTPHAELVAHSDDLLGEAARIIGGKPAFIGIVISALLACAAAVNATIFIAAKILTHVVNEHSEARFLTRLIGTGNMRPLLISSGIVIVMVLCFPLVAVGKMASMAFLLIYGIISFGHLRIRSQTGAAAWILWGGVLINGSLFVSLFINSATTAPASTFFLVVALIGTCALEFFYRCKFAPRPPNSV